MSRLYLECSSGISGDMTVAALLDLGADEKVLMKALAGITEGGFSYKISRTKKNGIDCCDFTVILDEAHATHDHDMDYLYGDKEPGHHHHTHEHRNLKYVTAIIEGLEMTDSARALALKIFGILAKAEAKAHNTTVDEVHFHEVGALDSIADIVAASVCFDNLGITEVIIPGVSEGKGNVRCQHGLLPIPVPAVANIATEYKLPLVIKDMEGEYITPTGAAFAAAVMTGTALPETIIPAKVGIGAGKREYKQANVLRAILFEDPVEEADYIIKLECNIDDSTGEMLGYTMERLMEAGARDVFFTPIYMKKNRPAHLLSVITDDDHVNAMEDIIFAETTTIGIRKQKMGRRILPRREMEVRTPYGSVSVKIVTRGDMEECHPEYESVRVISRAKNVPFRVVYGAAIEAWYNQHR